VIYRHATLKRHVASIQEHGLLPICSTGRLKSVWLHSRSRTAWAVLHVQDRHKVCPQDVVVLEVSVPQEWVKRSKLKGLLHCPVVIERHRITAVYEATECARSPIGEG
jgi:hypothetical protein